MWYETIKLYMYSHLAYLIFIKVGEPGQPKSFLIELSWGTNYPDELPTSSLDAFYNNHMYVRS